MSLTLFLPKTCPCVRTVFKETKTFFLLLLAHYGLGIVMAIPALLCCIQNNLWVLWLIGSSPSYNSFLINFILNYQCNSLGLSFLIMFSAFCHQHSVLENHRDKGSGSNSFCHSQAGHFYDQLHDEGCSGSRGLPGR